MSSDSRFSKKITLNEVPALKGFRKPNLFWLLKTLPLETMKPFNASVSLDDTMHTAGWYSTFTKFYNWQVVTENNFADR